MIELIHIIIKINQMMNYHYPKKIKIKLFGQKHKEVIVIISITNCIYALIKHKPKPIINYRDQFQIIKCK